LDKFISKSLNNKMLLELCMCASAQGYGLEFMGSPYIPLDVYIRLREIKDAI